MNALVYVNLPYSIATLIKFEHVACKNCCEIKIEILILRPNSPASLMDP